MPTKDITPLRADISNVEILDRIRNDASLSYQNRVPSATDSGVKATMDALLHYKPLFNEFVDALVNRIGTVIVRNTSWTNPLAEFKQGLLNYGDTVEEIKLGLVQSHTYNADADYLEKEIFGQEAPPAEVNYHRVNRQEYYKISINESLLRRAFVEGGSLAQFVSEALAVPTNSDQWDEFQLVTSLFAKYEADGGFYHMRVGDVSRQGSTEADAKFAIRQLRSMAGNLPFLSSRYNAARMPVFCNPDELILFASPEFQAAVDVEALAGAFNVEKMEQAGRIVTIPQAQFGIDDCQGILTTKDFLVLADVTLENTSQYNPVSMATNYFLHHWSINSLSRFVPAIMLSKNRDDEVITVRTPVTGIGAVTMTAGSTQRGSLAQFSATATTDGDNDGVIWSVEGENSLRTYITQEGVLHVGIDETAANVTVKATSSWIDPDNANADPFAASLVVALSGEIVDQWPVEGVLADGVFISYNGETFELVPAALNPSINFSAGVPQKGSDVALSVPEGSTGTVKLVNGKLVVTVDVGTGAPVVWTITMTSM